MAKNVLSLQLLRNGSVAPSKEAAISAIKAAGTQDGVIKLARYTDGDTVKTIFGIYNDTSVGTAGYTIYDSYQEVISAMQDQINELESGSTSGITEINKKLGDGVSTANTVTAQLQALSGTPGASSADTSVEGAKKYTDDKIATLDYTDTAVTGNYVSKVDEVDGVISVTREALPTVPAISETGKPITAVSESLGEISATAGTIEAQYVTITDSDSHYTATTVEGALAEVVSSYTAADEALKTEILGGASASADTLGELETLINNISADAKEYHIVKTTADLPAEIKERYSLQDADGHVSGDTIDIPKDSHIVSITYITGSTDPHYQNLEYVYIDASGNTQTEYVDISSLVLEAEFASGVTATNHVVHGVVDPQSESFLTVGADGFRLSGVQAAIDAAYEGLDASVTGGTTAGTATTGHVQVIVDEADGKLTAVTVTEANIADANKLAELSAKTVTEIGSSNSSISATTAATSDGTVSVDLVTDASKVKMTGFTADASGFTGITEASTVTQAVKAIETEYIANEQVTSQALNDLDTTKVDVISVNGVQSKTPTTGDVVATVVIDGADIKLDGYEKPVSTTAITSADTVNQAIGKLEKGLEAATSGGITGATVNNAPLAITSNVLTQTVAGKQTEATATNNEAIVVETDANGNLTLGLANLDAGTY